jgi:lysophospholipase L1-like esterase
MRTALGEGYEVIEEGLNGRCTVWYAPTEPGRNGSDDLGPCLLSHRPVDLVVIMLGTNDLKGIYGQTASEIACGAGALVDLARGTLAGPDDRPPRVLLVSPVPVVLTPHSEMWGFGHSIEEGKRLAGMYELMADGKGVGFFDAGSVTQVSPLDGVHLDEAGHATLGAAMAEAVRGELARG